MNKIRLAFYLVLGIILDSVAQVYNTCKDRALVIPMPRSNTCKMEFIGIISDSDPIMSYSC